MLASMMKKKQAEQQNTMSEEEQKLMSRYGKLPNHKSVLTKMQKERKYFDSGDYALQKAGKAPQSAVGTAIPNPENIPHATSPPANHQNLSISPTNSAAPIKEEVKPASEGDDAVADASATSAAATSDAAPSVTETASAPAPVASAVKDVEA